MSNDDTKCLTCDWPVDDLGGGVVRCTGCGRTYNTGSYPTGGYEIELPSGTKAMIRRIGDGGGLISMEDWLKERSRASKAETEINQAKCMLRGTLRFVDGVNLLTMAREIAQAYHNQRVEIVVLKGRIDRLKTQDDFDAALLEATESAVDAIADGQDQVEADLELRIEVFEQQLAEITAACDRCHVPGDDVVKRVKRMSAALVPKLDLSKEGIGYWGTSTPSSRGKKGTGR